MYFGSVRFFKHLILSTVALMIIVPTVLAVYFGASNHKNKLYAEELENQISSAEQAQTEHIAGIKPSPVISVPTYEYQTKYDNLYVESSSFAETENDKPVIYLTFDDGPSRNTAQVLDILKENNIKATFFIVDYQVGSEREALIVRAFNEGHTIGLHGTSHTYSKIYSSLEALIENFETLQEKVYNSTGYQSNIIRFPGGSSNTVSKNYCEGIMTKAVEYFSSTDFVYFDWNVDSQDAGGTTTPDGVFENVTSCIKPDRNNIVLMHDSGSKSHTLEALQAIIDWAISEGYEFKSITEETPQITHRIAN